MRLPKLPSWMYIGILLTAVYLIVHLFIMNDYGVTWDYTYHYNAGLWHLNLPTTSENFTMYSWGPISDIIPTLCSIIFTNTLKLLAWDSSYNLFSIVSGSLGILVLFLFTRRLFDTATAAVASLTLAFLPRYFGHLHTNMKDIPQAVFFTLAIYAWYRLIHQPRLPNLIFAVLMFAVTFNIKLTALFIIAIELLWLFLQFISRKIFKRKILPLLRLPIVRYGILYYIGSPLAAFALWSFFWSNPWERLIDAVHSVATTTMNMPVLYFGRLYQSGINIPWHYPYGMLLATIPFPVMLFFILGMILLLKNCWHKPENLLVILWFFIPILRFFTADIRVIDDIRYFLEVLFPLCIISAVGILYTLQLLITNVSNYMKMSHASRAYAQHVNFLRFVSLFIYLGYLIWQNIDMHPFQTSYFSEIVGGVKGASGKFDIDFWAYSYKYAASWINAQAPQNSSITVPMAPDIAKLYLRPDLGKQLNKYNMTYAKKSDYQIGNYTIILNRESFFNWYNIRDYMEKNTPVYTVTKHTVPLVMIYKNR